VKRSLRRMFVLNQPVIVLVVLLVLAVTLFMSFLLQSRAESGALSPIAAGTSAKEQREVDKLNAEIKQIRSDTGGSLFWLKMAGLFVTLGAAVGGYLIGQAKVTKDRLDFEHRQSVDNTYHALIQELSIEPPLLRVASAMRLGKLLQAPPVEWRVSDARRQELSQLTKQVLAASLAIEKDEKVLKALTIALGLHAEESEHADLRELDLSGAKARDAYWARIDFRYADFYGADLTDASLRKAILDGAQFRQTVLANAVLAEASCEGATFKLADLRGANLDGAKLRGTTFEDVRVFGATLVGAEIGDNPAGVVDISPNGDKSATLPVGEWLAQASAAA
jgi:Pentapeptide repeats (8 copies)